MEKQQVDALARPEVDVENYTVTVPLGPDGEWQVQMQWPNGVTQGGPAVLVIHPTDADPDNTCPTGGLSQTLLREVDFKDALDALRQELDRPNKWRQIKEVDQQRVTDLLKDHAAGGSITDTYLALLSRVYVGAVNRGQSAPIEHLAEITGKSEAAIKNHLWRATRKKFLERSTGRAGGRVGERAAPFLESLGLGGGLESLDQTARRLAET